MQAFIRSLVAAIIGPAFFGSATADVGETNPPPGVISPDVAWTQPLFGTGIKTNNSYTDGNIFLTYPLWSTIGKGGTLGGDYLFIEPYSSLGNGGEVAASLGMSWRHLFSDEPVSALKKTGSAKFMEEGWFLGGSFFVDMLDTQHRNSFWQLGVGIEAGTRYFEVRGNYYIPVTGEKLYDHQVTTQTFSSTTLKTDTSVGAPYASGNGIYQPFSTRTVATTQTTTVRTVTDLFEKGMEGWDAEASVLIPWLDQWMDLKVIGGYFSFDNQPFGPKDGPTGPVHGWKMGAEFRPVPAIVLSGYWYEDKRLTGGNWTAGVQFQVPLDKTWMDAFRMRRRHLVEHLAEPVHRQNDAVKIGNKKEQHSSQTTGVTVHVVNQTAGAITITDSVIFVDKDGINALQNGTFEHPFASVAQGSTIAAQNYDATHKVWTVYVQSSPQGTTYAEGSITVTTPVRFVASGAGGGIPAANGFTFGGTGTGPVVLGTITAGNNLTVTNPQVAGGAISVSQSANPPAGTGTTFSFSGATLTSDSNVNVATGTSAAGGSVVLNANLSAANYASNVAGTSTALNLTTATGTAGFAVISSGLTKFGTGANVPTSAGTVINTGTVTTIAGNLASTSGVSTPIVLLSGSGQTTSTASLVLDSGVTSLTISGITTGTLGASTVTISNPSLINQPVGVLTLLPVVQNSNVNNIALVSSVTIGAGSVAGTSIYPLTSIVTSGPGSLQLNGQTVNIGANTTINVNGSSSSSVLVNGSPVSVVPNVPIVITGGGSGSFLLNGVSITP